MLLGLDLGTGSAKTILIAPSGAVLGEGAASYPVRSPRPGWAESDPRDWWEACAEAVRAAVEERGSSVVALGLSGQMHGVVLSDAAGTPRDQPCSGPILARLACSTATASSTPGCAAG